MRCLLLGGGGPVGVAVLHLLKQLGWSAWVVDPRKPRNPAQSMGPLGPVLEGWTERQFSLDDLAELLRARQFDLLVDLTPTLDKRRSVLLADELGVSVVNSTMVDYQDDIHVAAFGFIYERPQVKRRPHVAAAGMNPGALNAMAEEVVRGHGAPDQICFWEYDDTIPQGGFRGPSTTWCPGESGAEMSEDWTFEVVEEGTILLHEDALSWAPQSFRGCGAPLEALGIPPEGDAFLIGHEECVYLGWRHDTAVRFVYGFHPENMRLIRQAGYGFVPELLVREPGRELSGRDIVGVSCRYDEAGQWVGRYCLLENSPALPCDTNATCWLVAGGVVAACKLLAGETVQPGVHLTHELTGYLPAFRSLVQVRECAVPVVPEGRP